MASTFNLTAQLNLRGPANIRAVVANIRRQIGTIDANVNIVVNPAAVRNSTALNTALVRLNTTLQTTTVNATSAANAINALVASMTSASSLRPPPALVNMPGTLASIGDAARPIGTTIETATGEITNFGRQAGLAVRRFSAFAATTGIIYSFTNAINSGLKAYIEFDKQLTRLSQVTEESRSGLTGLTNNITSLATSLGVSSSELANVSVTLAQAGLSAQDTSKALKALALSALAPSFDQLNDTVEGSIALMRQFGISAGDLEGALGSINSVAAKFAVEASDLITAIQRTGGVFASASRGVSEGTDALNEFLAIFTSIRATTRESAETIATGLRTIFTRIQRAETIDALKEFGVVLTDLEGKFVGPFVAVQRLAEGLGRLDPRDLKFSQIVEELGGFRQIGKVLPLIQQFATAQEALAVAQAGQGSLATDAAKGQLALAVQIQKVREEFAALIRSIGETDSFRTMITLGLDLASALIKVADATKGVLPLVGLMAAFKGISGITQFATGFTGGLRGTPATQTRRFATGGYVPGSGNSDTVPARLTPGEFVIRKKAVEAIGVGKLQALNRNAGGPIPIQRSSIGRGPIQRFSVGGSPEAQTSNELVAHRTHIGPKIALSPKQAKLARSYGYSQSYAALGAERQIDFAPYLPAAWNEQWRRGGSNKGVSLSEILNYVTPRSPEQLFGRGGIPSLLYSKLSSKKQLLPLKNVFLSGLRAAPSLIQKDSQLDFILPNYIKPFLDGLDLWSPLAEKQTLTIPRKFSGTDVFKTLLDKGVLKTKVRTTTPGIRKSLAQDLGNTFANGGSIRAFAEAGAVSATGGKPATASEILRVLGAQKAAAAGGISSADVYTLLKKQKLTPEQEASKKAIFAEFTKQQNRLSGAQKAKTTRAASKGLVFGAAGMMGSAFAPINKTINSDLLKSPVSVRIVSGLMNPDTASSLDQSFSSSVNKTARQAAKKVMVADILSNLGLGRELNLDFDRTLAFGADKVLADPKTPKFAEFGDRTKVATALKGAKLSLLGKELVGMVSQKPELLSSLRLITARPPSTLDLVHQWLSSQGLPIPLSQFKGLGGPGVSGSQIAKLKAELLSPGSVFVDDDVRNVKAAKARSKEGITSYRYGNRKSIKNTNADATAQGVIFERMIEQLGGPSALKGQGLDFPNGLKGAAKYFNIPGNIPTDAKRTISGPSTVEDNIVTYLKNVKGYNLGGAVQKFAVGGLAKPKDTLQQYFEDAAPINLGLSNSKALNKDQRKQLASDTRDLRKLRTSAPTELYSSISRNAFDKFAMDTGLNKNPDIPQGTRFNDRQSYYAPEVAKTIGKTFSLPGFVSTSKNYAVAKSFLDNAPRSEDNWAAMLTISTKKNAQGVDVAEQLKDRKINVTKQDINPRTGKMDTFFMKQPSEENEFMLSPRSRFRVDKARYVDLMGRHNLWANVQQYATGGSVQDTVPALLTPGEFVINKKAASSLGSSRLHTLNRADKIKGFNKGGPVGTVQNFAAGGAVQRFFFGGGPRVPARPGAQASFENLRIPDGVVASLGQMIDALEELGVRSSDSANILRRGGQISVDASTRAYQADILRLRLAGAPIQTIIDAETRLRDIRNQATQQVRAQQQLANVRGGTLENVDYAARNNIQRMVERARTSGVDLNADQMGRIENLAYTRAARGRIDPAAMTGLTGTDLRQFISTAMGDPRTFEQMNRAFETRRRAELTRQLTAEGRFGGDRNRILEEARRMAQQEARIRRDTLNETRGASGPGRTGIGSQAMMTGAFGIQMFGGILAQGIDRKSSAESAGLAAGLETATTGLGTGLMLYSQLDEMSKGLSNVNTTLGRFGSGLTRVAARLTAFGAAAFTIVSTIKDVVNAMNQFDIDLQKQKLEFSMKGVEQEFERLRKAANNIGFDRLNSALESASKAFASALDRVSKQSTITFTNLLDYIYTSMPYFGTGDTEGFDKRSEIERLGGKKAYYASRSDERSLADEYKKIIPQLAQEQAALGKALSDSLLESFKERAYKGESFQDIVNNPNFQSFAESLANADAVIRQRILELENSGLDGAVIEQEKKRIINAAAQEKTRQQILITIRDKEAKSIQRFTAVYTGSLIRMFRNMEQAIAATSFSLQQMQQSIDGNIAALNGQASLQSTELGLSNIINNPRSYNDFQGSQARATAGGFFGPSSNIVQSLLSVGETAESTVMKTVNSVLAQNPEANDEVISMKIDANLRQALKDLGLPPELSEKLAEQVGRAVGELRKSGEDKVSFSEIQDKVASLSKVLDTAQNVQGIVNKALENFGASLDSYRNNINKTIDLEISRRDKLRRADDILVNANVELAKVLGKTIDLDQSRQRLQNRTKGFTGGSVDPREIFNSILDLDALRRRQESSRAQVAERGPAGVPDFARLSNNVKDTSIALRENISGLKLLAESTEFASDAMQKMQDAQQRIGGKVSFIEKLVTSTPEELSGLNMSFVRLQRNMNGQINTINNSIGAQKAYREALNNGANVFEAMKSAQAAFANERKDTLGLLQDLLPFLGDSKQGSNVRANVLESMLQESGIGITPMFMDVLNSLRNPEVDPAVSAALAYYNEANALQAQANRYLANLEGTLAQDIADRSAKALSLALSKTPLTFLNAHLADIAAGINRLAPLQPQAKASGGIIYAAAGQMVDFSAKGTDTVPAMLTPGEFVVNRQATSRNRGLLESINSNKYSKGGKVRYYDKGGFVHDLGDETIFTKSARQSTTEIIDLNPPAAIAGLTKAKSALYQAPTVYTFLNSPKQTPKADDNTLSLDLKDLEPDAGTRVVPGMGPILMQYTDEEGATKVDYQIWDRAEAALSRFAGIKDEKSFFHTDGSDSLSTIKLNELELEKYKKKAKDNNIDWSLAKYNLDLNNFGSMPFPSDFIGKGDKFATTIVKGKSLGIAKERQAGAGPSLFDERKNMYKIWKPKRGGETDVVSTNFPNFAMGTPYASTDFEQKREAGTALVMSNWEKDVITFDKLGALKDSNDESYEKYVNTANFLRAPTFDDKGEVDAKTLTVQNQLSKLYNGSVGEIFSEDISKYFDQLKITGKTNSLAIFNPGAVPALNKTIEELAANPIIAKQRDLMFSGAGLKATDAAGKALPFVDPGPPQGIRIKELDDLGAIRQRSKAFPYVINGKLEDLDPVLRQQLEAQLAAANPGGIKMTRLPEETLAVPVPAAWGLQQLLGGNPNMDLKIVYDEWEGKLYDPINRQFDPAATKLFLPSNTDGTLFEGINPAILDKRRIGLFPGAKYTPGDINKALNAVALPNADVQKYINSILTDPTKPDAAAKTNLQKAMIGQLDSSFIKSLEMVFPGLDTLVSPVSNQPFGIEMGEHILAQIDRVRARAGNQADSIANKGFKNLTVDDKDIPEALRRMSKSALQIFGRARVPGVRNGWLSSYIGKVPNLQKINSGQAKNISGYAANVMENFGGYLSSISNSIRRPDQFQYLKEVYTVASGAAKAFAGLSSGDTGLLAQFNMVGSDYMSLFRTLGGTMLMSRLSGLQLSPDWQNILGAQIQNGLVRTVSPNGTLGRQQMVDAIPTDLMGLIKLLFNPYNEFADVNTRKDLMDKFVNDISSFKGSNGLPYFDQFTLKYLVDRVNVLKEWYGGNPGWVGQDFLFDKVGNPDNVTRSNTFQASLAANLPLRSQANIAHTTLGLAKTFGELPDPNWFGGRVVQGFQTGGMVYAAGGGQMVNFQPRGTDTVPAMLTPGEFVINKQAAQSNLPLLQEINSGKAYSRGGVVYAQFGGEIDQNVGVGTDEQMMSDQEMKAGYEAKIRAENRANKIAIITEAMQKYPQLILDLSDTVRPVTTFDMMSNSFKTTTKFDEAIARVRSQDTVLADELFDHRVKVPGIVSSLHEELNNYKRISGFDGKYGTWDDTEFLDDISMSLAGLGLIPAVGNIFDLASIPIDLLRADTTSAGLSALSLVEGVGQAAGATKMANLASTAGMAGIFATRAANRGINQQGALNLFDLIDEIKAKGNLKPSSERLGILNTLQTALSGKTSSAKATEAYEKAIKDLSIMMQGHPDSKGIDYLIQSLKDAAYPVKGSKGAGIGKYLFNKTTFAGAAILAALAYYASLDKKNVDQAARNQAPQEEIEASIPDVSGKQVTAQEMDDVRKGVAAPEVKEKVEEWKEKTASPADKEAAEKLAAIQKIIDDYPLNGIKGNPSRIGREKQATLEKAYPEDLSQRLRVYKQTERDLKEDPGLFYRARGGMIYANNGMMIPYSPRGTDTVPAMLTPGEFVVNRASTQANLPLLQAINNNQVSSSIKGFTNGGIVYADDGGTIPTKPDGSADTNFNARKAQRTAYLQRQIEKEEKAEFIDRLGILYNDTTDKQDIIEALKKQRDYKTKIDYYLRQFSTDNEFGLRLKRYPRISEAGKSILAKKEQPKANPFDMGQQPAATPQSLSRGGVIYAAEGFDPSRPLNPMMNRHGKGPSTTLPSFPSSNFDSEKLVEEGKAAGYGAAKSVLPGLAGLGAGALGLPTTGPGGFAIGLGAGAAVYQAQENYLNALAPETNKNINGTIEDNWQASLLGSMVGGFGVDKASRKLLSPVMKNTPRMPAILPNSNASVRPDMKSATQEALEEFSLRSRPGIQAPSLSPTSSEPGMLDSILTDFMIRSTSSSVSNKDLTSKIFSSIVSSGSKLQPSSQRGKLPNVYDTGAKIAETMGLSQPKSRAWIQQFNNCLGIAMKLADDNGYHVDMASIERQIEKASEFAAAKRGNVPWLNKPSPKLLESPYFRRMWEDPTKPSSTAHILIRESQGSEEQFMKHASFEHFGKEFNFGAAGPQWPISLRIPLKRKMPVAKSNGGIIYASTGTLVNYQPRGTDTVPAMLTPGEFVVNRAATQKHLPLLKSINNGGTATGYSNGGPVYLAAGGVADFGDAQLVPSATAKNRAQAKAKAQQKQQERKQEIEKNKQARQNQDVDRLEGITEARVKNGVDKISALTVNEVKALFKNKDFITSLENNNSLSLNNLKNLPPTVAQEIFKQLNVKQLGWITDFNFDSLNSLDQSTAQLFKEHFTSSISAKSLTEPPMSLVKYFVDNALQDSGGGSSTDLSSPTIGGRFRTGIDLTPMIKEYYSQLDPDKFGQEFGQDKLKLEDMEQTSASRIFSELSSGNFTNPYVSSNLAKIKSIIQRNPEQKDDLENMIGQTGALDLNGLSKIEDSALKDLLDFCVDQNLPINAVSFGTDKFNGQLIDLMSSYRDIGSLFIYGTDINQSLADGLGRSTFSEISLQEMQNMSLGTARPLSLFSGKLYMPNLKAVDEAALRIFAEAGTEISPAELLAQLANKPPVQNRANGGLIYASQGTLVNYQPRGTDTVPAMLTPGEFVINREATQQNLGLLQAINKGQDITNHLSDGGIVNPIYRPGGGPVGTSYREILAERAANYKKQQADRRQAYKDQRGLNQAGLSRLATFIVNQINTNPNLFEELNNDAIKEDLSADTIAQNYIQEFQKIADPAQRYNTAKGRYVQQANRFNYLKTIIQNTKGALTQLKDKDKNYKIPQRGNITLGTILDTQFQTASQEASIMDQVWQKIGNAFPEFKNQGPTQSQQFVPPAAMMNKGGVVYASNGMLVNYQPQGSDTVPAMLTPGEFVVNRNAAQKHLGLLQGINNGYYSGGGRVKYLADGTPGTDVLQQNIAQLSSVLQLGAESINAALTGLSTTLNGIRENLSGGNTDNRVSGVSNNTTNNPIAAINALGTKLDQFIERLQTALPPVINVKLTQDQPINVTINGANVLQNLLSGPIGGIIQNAIQSAFDARSRTSEGSSS